MRIVCDRCKKESTDFNHGRKDWKHIETAEKGYGKLGDYYICPKCAEQFYAFMNGFSTKSVEEFCEVEE